eukprot:scaffold6103_cov65-Phaeocystis_antarctica.AAC.1
MPALAGTASRRRRRCAAARRGRSPSRRSRGRGVAYRAPSAPGLAPRAAPSLSGAAPRQPPDTTCPEERLLAHSLTHLLTS